MTKTTPMSETEFYGKVAYHANCKAWPPTDKYVEWGKLPDQAKRGWESVAAAVLGVYNDA